ncbi:MAG: GIY-YIG nuclease family protein, partial [Rudaea sp.]
ASVNAKQPAVYIMASGERGTLYIGVTGWLKHRIWEHREELVEGFSKAHQVKHLVWYEFFEDFPSAIKREKQLKKWNRAWKLELIEGSNPHWRDLWEEVVE